MEHGFGVLTKKFKFFQSPVRLHHVDDIFYIVKLCICLHNAMVVHRIENGDNPEFEQLYEQIDAKEAQSNCKAKDKAISKIIEEDLFFLNNKQKLDLDSNKIDLELLHKYRHAQNLGQRLQIINR